MDSEGNVYSFEAPPTEIQPAFEEVWNGFVAMVNTIEEVDISRSDRSQHVSAISIICCMIITVLMSW